MNTHQGAAVLGELDWLGAEGGRLAAAFGTGCVATWGFLQGFFWRGIRKSYEARIEVLEKDNERCEERQVRLETMLWMHGPSQLRQQLAGVISEVHLEVREALIEAKEAKHETGR
jgi:hypothetical protein